MYILIWKNIYDFQYIYIKINYIIHKKNIIFICIYYRLSYILIYNYIYNIFIKNILSELKFFFKHIYKIYTMFL